DCGVCLVAFALQLHLRDLPKPVVVLNDQYSVFSHKLYPRGLRTLHCSAEIAYTVFQIETGGPVDSAWTHAASFNFLQSGDFDAKLTGVETIPEPDSRRHRPKHHASVLANPAVFLSRLCGCPKLRSTLLPPDRNAATRLTWWPSTEQRKPIPRWLSAMADMKA